MSSNDSTVSPRQALSADAIRVLSDLGFDVATRKGHGCFGTVYSGVCNINAKKWADIDPNKLCGNSDDIDFDPIGRTYRQCISLNGRPCAVKVYNRTNWTDNDYNEAKTMTDLQHPNVIEIYAVCKSENQIYFVMEYLSGKTLKTFLNSFSMNTKINEMNAIIIIRHTTTALQYLHNKGVVHGDLHYDNIMYTTTDGNPVWKLLDFGNTKALVADNNRRDIFNLGYNLILVLDKSAFNHKALEGNIRSVLTMMCSGVFTEMNQVLDHLAKYMPTDRPTGANPWRKRLSNVFSSQK